MSRLYIAMSIVLAIENAVSVARGRPTGDVNLEESRRRFRLELQRLPEHLWKLEVSPVPCPATFSEYLHHDLDTIRSELARGS